MQVFTGISPEEENYLRVIHLIVKVAPTAVRVKFDEEFPPDRLKTILNQHRYSVLGRLKYREIITFAQMRMLFPTSGEQICMYFKCLLDLIKTIYLQQLLINEMFMTLHVYCDFEIMY